MPIRHVIGLADYDPARGVISAPQHARHAVIVAGRLHDLSGPIDPTTHLNLDEPAHLMTTCIVAEHLDRGGAIIQTAHGPLVAPVDPAAFQRLGPVDHGAQRLAWLTAVGERRAQRVAAGT